MFSEQLRNLRKRADLTQKEFAQMLNVAVGTVGMWEIGKREPDFKTVNRIADFFHVSTDYLFGRKEDREKPTPDDGDGLTPEFVRLYEQLSEEEKAFVVKQMKGLLVEE